MPNKNFDFLTDKNKIELAKSIEQSYWNYYFCDEWSTDDIDFHLRMKYMFGNDVITMDEYFKIIETIEEN